MPPPAHADLLVWPEDFGQRFTVFVDTEEEFDWSAPLSREGHQTRAIAALPEAHRRFAERGVPLTYLVDYPIASDQAAVAVLQRLVEDGRSAIGTQLHPWVNPPLHEELNPFNSFVGNLSLGLEAAKLAVLTDMITHVFGTRPLIYRAGRYGIGPNSHATLAKLGYRIDSSIRARYDYSHEGGPDFRAIGSHAFRTGPEGKIVALPATTVFTGALRGLGEPLYDLLGKIPRGRGVGARLGLLSRVALTPEDMPLKDAIEAVRVAAGEGLRVLNFAFHSPSVAPGHTPYVRDASDLAAFHRWWDTILVLLDRLGVRPAGQADLLAAIDASR